MNLYLHIIKRGVEVYIGCHNTECSRLSDCAIQKLYFERKSPLCAHRKPRFGFIQTGGSAGNLTKLLQSALEGKAGQTDKSLAVKGSC